MRARYYDPETGRFIQRDSKPGNINEPLSQNPYIYCRDNPIGFIDRTGLDRIDFYLIGNAKNYDENRIRTALQGHEVNFYFFDNSKSLVQFLALSFRSADYVVVRGHSGSVGFGVSGNIFGIGRRVILTGDDLIEAIYPGVYEEENTIATKRFIGQGCHTLQLEPKSYNLKKAFSLRGITYIGQGCLEIFNDAEAVNFILSDIRASKPTGERLDDIIRETMRGYERLK